MKNNSFACQLNIGLDVGPDMNGGPRLTVDQVLAALRKHRFQALRHTVVASDTEPTAVVSVVSDNRRLSARLMCVSEDLHQDCIAVHNPGAGFGSGFLIGPKDHEWGDFNPCFFFTHDGKRLA